MNIILSAAQATALWEWDVCEEANVGLYIFMCLAHLGKDLIPSIGDSTAIIQSFLLIVIMKFLSPAIRPWSVSTFCDKHGSISVIHLCSSGTPGTSWWGDSGHRYRHLPQLLYLLHALLFLIHYLYCCLSLTSCPSVGTLRAYFFDFQVANQTVPDSFFIVLWDPKVLSVTLRWFDSNYIVLMYKHCTIITQ